MYWYRTGFLSTFWEFAIISDSIEELQNSFMEQFTSMLMETLRSFETSVDFYLTTPHYIQDGLFSMLK
jgi:hypothetical protein